jgi:hypothetical protein
MRGASPGTRGSLSMHASEPVHATIPTGVSMSLVMASGWLRTPTRLDPGVQPRVMRCRIDSVSQRWGICKDVRIRSRCDLRGGQTGGRRRGR